MDTNRVTEMLAQQYFWQFRYERNTTKTSKRDLKTIQGQNAGMFYMLEACAGPKIAAAIDEEARCIARQREESQWREVLRQREMNAA